MIVSENIRGSLVRDIVKDIEVLCVSILYHNTIQPHKDPIDTRNKVSVPTHRL